MKILITEPLKKVLTIFMKKLLAEVLKKVLTVI